MHSRLTARAPGAVWKNPLRSARRGVRRGAALVSALLPFIAVLAGIGVLGDPSSAATVVSVPSTIDASGTTDVTQQLNSFLQAVPQNSVVQFPAGARYRVEGIVRFVDFVNVTVEGNGATFFATTDGSTAPAPSDPYGLSWPRHRTHLLVQGGDGVVIRNIVIKGAHPNGGLADSAWVSQYEAQHGVEFAGSKNTRLENCTITDVYGDLVAITRDTWRSWAWSDGVTVTGCHMERNGRQGVSVVDGRNVLIEGNYLGNTRRATIDIEPDTAAGGASGVTIANNIIGPGKLLFIASGGQGGNVSDVTVSGNVLKGKTMNSIVQAPPGYRRSNFRFLNNSTDMEFGSPLALLAFIRVDGIEVSGNYSRVLWDPTEPDVYSGLGVAAGESCYVKVSGNHFEGAKAEVQTDGYTNCAPQPTTDSTTTTTTSTTTTVAPAAGTVTDPGSTTSGITVSLGLRRVKGVHTVDVTWRGATTTKVDIWRDGQRIATTPNDSRFVDSTGQKGNGRYAYRVCEQGSTVCSSDAVAQYG